MSGGELVQFGEFPIPGAASIDARIESQKGAAEGVASLDEQGRVPETELPERLAEAALSATIARSGAPLARDGHEYVWLAGVIRNQGDGNGWQLLPESTNHRPVNITAVETVDEAEGGYIRVHYPAAVGQSGMTVVMLAVTDETLAANGFTVGTSVTQRYSDIRISQSLRAVTDYLYAENGKLVSYDGRFTPSDHVSGVTTLSHENITARAQYAVSIESRNFPQGGYKYAVDGGDSSATPTQLRIAVLDDAPAYEDFVSYDGTKWVSQNGIFTPAFASGVLTLTHAPLPGRAQQRVGVTQRADQGAPIPQVSTAAGPVSTTEIKIEWRDTAGARVQTPNANMRAYVRHGGATGQRVTTLDEFVRLYVTHGGGNRRWKPSELDTLKFPGSNIWLFGVMGRPAT